MVKTMRYGQVVILIFIAILFSGCLENITARFQNVDVVYVNVSVIEQDNRTIIQDIEAKGGTLNKLKAPGWAIPKKQPAIYIEILQLYNISMPDTFTSISPSNGLEYTGAGNYSFTISLFENVLDRNQPIRVYSEIVSNNTRVARESKMFNLTE